MFDHNRLATKPICQLLNVRERDRDRVGFFESPCDNEISRDPEMSVYEFRIRRLQEPPAPRQLMIRCQAVRGGKGKVHLDFDLAGRVLLTGPRVEGPHDIHCWKQAMRPVGDLDSIHFDACVEKKLTEFFRPIYVQRDHPCSLRWCVFSVKNVVAPAKPTGTLSHDRKPWFGTQVAAGDADFWSSCRRRS